MFIAMFPIFVRLAWIFDSFCSSLLRSSFLFDSLHRVFSVVITLLFLERPLRLLFSALKRYDVDGRSAIGKQTYFFGMPVANRNLFLCYSILVYVFPIRYVLVPTFAILYLDGLQLSSSIVVVSFCARNSD